MRNLAAVAVFLFGSTFLWLTPAMNGNPGSPEGTAWVAVQGLAWVTVFLFCVAAWGLIRGFEWWPTALGVASVAGLAATTAYLVAAVGSGGIPYVTANAGMHTLVCVGFLAVVLVPGVRAQVGRRLRG